MERYRDRVLPIRYSNIKAKRAKIHGMTAFRFTYVDGGKGLSGGVVSADDLMEELRRRRESAGKSGSKNKGKPRQYVEYLLVGFGGNFSIKASAEKGEFASHEKAFDLLAEYFEPIHQRRW